MFNEDVYEFKLDINVFTLAEVVSKFVNLSPADAVNKFNDAVLSCNLVTCAAIEAVKVWRVKFLASCEEVYAFKLAVEAWILPNLVSADEVYKFIDAVLSSILVNLVKADALNVFKLAVDAWILPNLVSTLAV